MKFGIIHDLEFSKKTNFNFFPCFFSKFEDRSPAIKNVIKLEVCFFEKFQIVDCSKFHADFNGAINFFQVLDLTFKNGLEKGKNQFFDFLGLVFF